MKYVVVLTEKAKDDLRQYYAVAAEHAPQTAIHWLDRFEQALQSLSENPQRCGVAPENDLVDPTIYQYFFGRRLGRYRVLFSIESDCVSILHIRRGTMDKATESELF